MNKLFKKDIKHPDVFSVVSGQINLVTEIEAINQSLRLILSTEQGELMGDPTYGCHLKSYLFEYQDDVLLQLICDDIIENVNRLETRIRLDQNSVTAYHDLSNQTVHVSIYYYIQNTEYASQFEYDLSQEVI